MSSSPLSPSLLPEFALPQVVRARIAQLGRTEAEHCRAHGIDRFVWKRFIENEEVSVLAAVQIIESVGFENLDSLITLAESLSAVPVDGDRDLRFFRHPEHSQQTGQTLGQIVAYLFKPRQGSQQVSWLETITLLQPYSYLTQDYLNETHRGHGWTRHGPRTTNEVERMLAIAATGDIPDPLYGISTVGDSIKITAAPIREDGLVPMAYSIIEKLPETNGFVFQSVGPFASVFIAPRPKHSALPRTGTPAKLYDLDAARRALEQSG